MSGHAAARRGRSLGVVTRLVQGVGGVQGGPVGEGKQPLALQVHRRRGGHDQHEADRDERVHELSDLPVVPPRPSGPYAPAPELHERASELVRTWSG